MNIFKRDKEKQLYKNQPKIKKTKTPFSKEKVQRFFMGSKDDMGLLKKVIIYVILVCVGFIFVYPLVQMVATSFMSLTDLLNPSVTWIPSKFSFDNYKAAIKAMDYWDALFDSLVISGIPTLCQLVVCSLVGYGLARYNFKGRTLVMMILIISFIIPTQVMQIPVYFVYSKVGITGKITAFILPAILGQGFKSQLFILICWAFFRQIPQVLNEAAQIDGAGHFKQYFKIALPSARGALVVVALFSFVWYWNEDYLTKLYLYSNSNASLGKWEPVINKLQLFNGSFGSSSAQLQQYGSETTGVSMNQAYSMVATVLAILPLLILYCILQKQFVESIDRAGITGE